MSTRLTSMEAKRGIGRDAEGNCRHCHERTDLGRVVVYEQHEDEPMTLRPDKDDTPTPCPSCGRDMNVRIVVHYVDMVNAKRKEMGLPPVPMGRMPEGWTPRGVVDSGR